MYKPHKVLFLGAHPDDELNAAGTLNKFALQGALVNYAIFTQCKEDSIELGFDPLVLLNEMRSSLGIINSGRVAGLYLKEYQARYLSGIRQTILDDMFELNKKISPDLIIVPNTKDLHQDHITITQEARRVFRHCSIFGYESDRAPIPSENICFIRLENINWDAKLAAISCYKTQVSRINIGIRKSLARLRGSQAGYEYAEAFEVIRLYS